jgi:serine/threonine protein kinase
MFASTVLALALVCGACRAQSERADGGNDSLDVDKSGLLSFDELAQFLQQLDDGVQSTDELRVLFARFDVDGDLHWSKDEFRAFKQSLRSLVGGAGGRGGPSLLVRVMVAIVVVLVTMLALAAWYIRNLIGAPSKAIADASARRASSLPHDAEPAAAMADATDELRALRQAAIIPPETIELTRSFLGQGIGGTVVVGLWQQTTSVACKTLRSSCTQREINDFLSEIKLILNLPMHPNILQVFGVSHKDESLILVMEYLPLGNLLDTLRKKTLGAESEEHFSLTQLLLFSQDICKGMVHLATHHIVHRDLAARNVLLAAQESRFIAKVCDFGLSRTVEYLDINADEPIPSANERHLAQSVGPRLTPPIAVAKTAPALPTEASFAGTMASLLPQCCPPAQQSPDDGYADVDATVPPKAAEASARPKSPALRRAPSTESKPLPIKWMAPETLFGKFSHASDVWSYGVVLFEIFSLGEEPYSGFTALEVLRHHRKSSPLRMEKPEECPADVFEMMLETWKTRPSERPTFQQLHRRVDDLLLAHDDNFFESSSSSSSSKLWAAAHRRHATRRSATPSPAVSPQASPRNRRRSPARSESLFSLELPGNLARRSLAQSGEQAAPRAGDLKRRSRSVERLQQRNNVAGYVDEPFDMTPSASISGTDEDGYVRPQPASSGDSAHAMPYILDSSDDGGDYIEPEVSPTRNVPRIVLTASIDDDGH